MTFNTAMRDALRTLYGRAPDVAQTKTPLAGGVQGDTQVNSKIPLTSAIRNGAMTITPLLAERILAEAHYEKQRPIKASQVQLLLHLMREHRFRVGSQITLCRVGNALFLTNGQHSLTALVLHGQPHMFSVWVQPCRNMDDVEIDYRSHDTATRKRSNTEVMKSSEELMGAELPARVRDGLFKCAIMLRDKLAHNHYTHDATVMDVEERIRTATEWLPEATDYARLIHGCRSDHIQPLCNAGVMAVALITIRFQPAIAHEFWHGVAMDDGLRKGDPRKALLDDFATRVSTKGAQYAQRVLPAGHAWNAYFNHLPLKLIRVSAGTVMPLAGTDIERIGEKP